MPEPQAFDAQNARRFTHPEPFVVRDAVERALAEDLGPFGDLSAALLDATYTTTARFVAREAGVIAGVSCAEETLHQVDPMLRSDWNCDEGARVEAAATLGTVHGSLESVLIAERTALNFLGHLSGIATLTDLHQQRCGGAARVWDTRKTTPGLRSLEKAAVRCGGGVNHRGGLSDWIMIKDNHLMGMSITSGVARARELWPARTVHVECDRPEQLHEALLAVVDAVLLDNMDPAMLRECVAIVDEHQSSGGRRPLLEASGGVTLDTISEIAQTGVDFISVGAITNSAPVLDIGLDIDEPATADGGS